MLKRCLFAISLVACGGSKAAQKPVTDPGTGIVDTGNATSGLSECAVLAGHVADTVMTAIDAPDVPKKVVSDLVQTHCETDAWSADVKKCFAEITKPEGGEACAKQLTADQQTKLKEDADTKFGKRKKRMESKEMSDDDADEAADKNEGKMGKGKPAPAMKAPARSAPPKPAKGPVKSNDPCEGGE